MGTRYHHETNDAASIGSSNKDAYKLGASDVIRNDNYYIQRMRSSDPSRLPFKRHSWASSVDSGASMLSSSCSRSSGR
eukprot:CAMPEP_0194185680 /NCGR_PEP_ID=MMETSP0154-20130528/43762_1 /TAXON_ID=1049557 /ORGANISM="Thalassiothrix antarctica, Strain L6-D1" /LENGTH=77 /DNA_ID=CAMNT_0038904211 /DNA_START=176 /DNA_END=406 /DNA_ORIENTATION=-